MSVSGAQLLPSCAHPVSSVVLSSDMSAPPLEPLLHAAAALLCQQWPDVSLHTRMAALKRQVQSSSEAVVVLLHNQTVIGHANIAAATKAQAVMTSVLISPTHRGRGLGRLLVAECEKIARSRSWEYMYLSTPDKQRFYEHLSYSICKPISSLKSNSHRLTDQQRTQLETLLSKNSSTTPSPGAKTANVWLRKRLMEEHPCQYRNEEDCTQDILRAVGTGEWEFVYINIPWMKQIGPSCGLATIGMIRGFLFNPPQTIRRAVSLTSTKPDGVEQVHSQKTSSHAIHGFRVRSRSAALKHGVAESLLETAIRKGYTVDGEMFSADCLCQLIQMHLEVGAKLLVNPTTTMILKYLQEGNLVLIAYDRSANHEPCEQNGNNAHWLCIHGWALETSSQNAVVIASHGLSKHLLCCSLSLIIESNKQLTGPILHNGEAKMIGIDNPQLSSRAIVVRVVQES